MTAASDGTMIVLSGGELACPRDVPAICSQALARARDHAGPIAGAMGAQAVRAAGGNSVSTLIRQVSLAVGYLGSAPPARSWR